MMGHKIMASILATKASGFWQVFAAIHTHIISEMEQKLEYVVELLSWHMARPRIIFINNHRLIVFFLFFIRRPSITINIAATRVIILTYFFYFSTTFGLTNI